MSGKLEEGLRLYKKMVRAEGTRAGNALQKRWPELMTRLSMDTYEGEDAYLWIYIPESIDEDTQDEIRDEAIGLLLDIYDEKGIDIHTQVERIKLQD